MLRALLFKLSIWDHDASYGAALQDLKYIDVRSKGPIHSSPTKWQKGIYGLLTVGGRYAWDKWESWLVGQTDGYDEVRKKPATDTQTICAYANLLYQPSYKVQLLGRITDLASTTHSVAAFVSFLVFLVNGRYRTLIDRILRMRLTPPSAQASREVSFEYLNRQLVWHAFTEFLLFLLPLVGITRWRRWLSRAWRKTKSALQTSPDEDEPQEKKGELAFLPERTCAICYKDQNPEPTSESDMMAASAAGGMTGSGRTDVANPYEAIPCGCIYCFVCLVQKVEGEEGEGWTCLRCGEIVKKCKPWNGDVLEEVRPQPTSGKAVGFAIDNETDANEDEGGDEGGDEGEDEGEDDSGDKEQSAEGLEDSKQWSTVDQESAEGDETAAPLT